MRAHIGIANGFSQVIPFFLLFSCFLFLLFGVDKAGGGRGHFRYVWHEPEFPEVIIQLCVRARAPLQNHPPLSSFRAASSPPPKLQERKNMFNHEMAQHWFSFPFPFVSTTTVGLTFLNWITRSTSAKFCRSIRRRMLTMMDWKEVCFVIRYVDAEQRSQRTEDLLLRYSFVFALRCVTQLQSNVTHTAVIRIIDSSGHAM